MDLSPSPVPSSSVVPQLLYLRRPPVLLSFTRQQPCLARQFGSQFLCRSPVTEPTSFAGPPFVHGSANLPRSPVRFPVPLSFTGPRTYVVHRSPLRQSVIGSPSSVIRRSSFPYAHGSMDLSRSPFPTSSVLQRFPLTLLFISSQLIDSVFIRGCCM
jgi:hypothetical protein